MNKLNTLYTYKYKYKKFHIYTNTLVAIPLVKKKKKRCELYIYYENIIKLIYYSLLQAPKTKKNDPSVRPQTRI